MTAPLLEIEHLRVTFAGSSKQRLAAVEDLSLAIESGEALVIVGESGSGKTLTALSILGLTPPTAAVEGSIRFAGTDLARASEKQLRQVRGRDIAMIYQDPMSALDPVWSIESQITEVIREHEDVTKAEASRRTISLLERVGLPEPSRIARAYPHELSGGMRQRTLIAMALACSPRLLIGDEPTTALDVTIQAQILELLRDLRRDLGLTLLLITHNMGVAADIADRVLVMYAGRAVEVADANRLFQSPRHPYTEALLNSAELGGLVPKTPLLAIPGVPPPIDARPSGCAFHPRCPRAQALCADDRPELTGDDGEVAACFFPLPSASEASGTEMTSNA